MSANYWPLSSGRQLVRVAALRVEAAGYEISLPQNPGQECTVNMIEPTADGVSDPLGLEVLYFKLVRLKDASKDDPLRQSMMKACG